MPNPMTKSDSSRVQSSQAKSGGDMSSSGFAARAQSAGDQRAHQANTSGHGENNPGSGANAGTKK
ncbi:hypothetical protein J3459_018191 [Metarhizium acridum]|uniref:uncharacterized protein n=1 Tax=Metarhizium acridum TaxID=92637 RepID=UPI001C6BC4D6|nr:hypothetical protein J3459_018474 [Metarhizium acridum]KAG8408093.1 hypothetical protein J3459_018191 [Metarhizium acridum]KAG8413035.1 hypothetical protein J3458_013456 [Metarhizium acridum]